MLFWSKYDDTRNNDYYVQLFSKLFSEREKKIEENYKNHKIMHNRATKEVVNLLNGKIYKSAKDAEKRLVFIIIILLNVAEVTRKQPEITFSYIY